MKKLSFLLMATGLFFACKKEKIEKPQNQMKSEEKPIEEREKNAQSSPPIYQFHNEGQVGNGFTYNNMPRIFAFKGGLLGIKSNGDLYKYGFGGQSSVSSGSKVGTGWNNINGLFVDDWDGDGYDEIIGKHNNGKLYYYQIGNGISSPVQVGSGWYSQFTHYFVGDFTGDGKADLMVRRTNGTMHLYPFNGSNFSSPSQVSSGWNFDNYVCGDFNNDNKTDLLVKDGTGNVYLYPFNGNSFGARSQMGNGFGSHQNFRAFDYNGDGLDDIVTKANGYNFYYKNTGTYFQSEASLPLFSMFDGGRPSSNEELIFQDFYLDGKDDLISRDYTSGVLTYYEVR